MARYTIDFTTNAGKIVREIEEVNKKVAQAVRIGKSIEINLDASKLQQEINATFKSLDKQIQKYERQLRKIKIGSPEFIAKAREIGQGEGLRERGALQARSASLREQAFAFEGGSEIALKKSLQALQIEASQIKPATQEWAVLQQRIASISVDLKKADVLAENIQMQASLGAYSPGSLNELEARLVVLKNRAREVSPSGSTIREWKQLNAEIIKTEQSIEKQTRRPLTKGQRFGAAGGAFLYGGGLGGGLGSAAGGIAGGLAGGVPAAFTGAAIGQAVDNLSAMAFAMNEQANAIKRMRLGLASASTDLNDFAEANQLVADISDRLLIPIGEVYGQFTRLRASTVALGIDTKTTGEVFEGVSIAVLKTGGSMEDVSGAMRAVSQVFSKGKVTAEELRGQLGERLPGAVVKFAKENKIALQDLDKAFESGQVSVDQFVTFAKGLLKEGEGYSDALANNQEYASARYAKAVERMQLAIGKAVGPMLNSIQDFAAEAITSILQLSGELEKFAKYMESRFGGGAADSAFLGEGARNIADRVIGGDVEVKDLEDRTRFFESAIKKSQATLEQIQGGGYRDQRSIFERMFGGPGEENLRKNLPAQIAYYKKQLKELLDARKLAEEKTKGESALIPGGADPEADKRATAFFSAIERREEAIAGARENYEQEIASIRENAIKQAETLQRRYQDQRLRDERELEKVRRDLAASVGEESFLRREISGEDPALVEQERKIGEAIRQYTEDKISREEQAQDRQIGLSRELEDFKRQNADAINKANERYANAIGKIQQEYAKSVAKLIEDGSGAGARKLAAAGKVIAAEIKKATQQQAFTAATGAAIIPRGQKFEVAGDLFDEQGLYAAADATSKAAGTAARAYVAATKDIESAQKDLNATMKITARFGAVSVASVNVSDIEASIKASQQALSQSISLINGEKEALSRQQNIRNTLLEVIKEAGAENRTNTRDIDNQNEIIAAQLQLMQQGMLPSLAEEAIQNERAFATERKRVQSAAEALIKGTANAEIQSEIKGELEKQLKYINDQEEAYGRLRQRLRDNKALLEASAIQSQIGIVGQGLRAGFINEAGAAYEEQISRGVSPDVAASVARATEQLTMAKTAADAFQGSITGIGSAFGEAMTTGLVKLTEGTATAKEVFSSFLKSIADALLQAAAQMIATYTSIGIAKMFAGLGGGGADMSKTGITEGALAPMRQYTDAAGNMAPNFAGFANGGIAPGGFRAFANGGVVSGPTLGLVGEGRYNEAVVPLPDGKSIPVQLGGGAGGDISTNIVVNVSNGQASSQMSGNGGQALGRELEGAVRQVILKETRPGGLIYSAR